MNQNHNNELYHDIIHCLVQALEAKDPYTCGHSTRVGEMAYELAVHLGLSENICDEIHIAGHLHDIGKIGVPDSTLNNKGALSEDEWHMIKKHPMTGYEILRKSKKLKRIAEIVKSHHERWDGQGYPNGLLGEKIPLGARIIAICDTIDAMTSVRPYRHPFGWNACWEEVIRNAGSQFDSEIINHLKPVFRLWKQHYEVIEASVG